MQTFPGQFYVKEKTFALESQILFLDHVIPKTAKDHQKTICHQNVDLAEGH